MAGEEYYLKYDHSTGPRPTDPEYIGPFPTPQAAQAWLAEHFAETSPVTTIATTMQATEEDLWVWFAITPEEAHKRQQARS